MIQFRTIKKIIILSLFLCLISLNVYAAETFSGSDFSDLNTKIEKRLRELGYNEDLNEASNSAETIVNGRTVIKNFEVKWETTEKEYKAIIKSNTVGTGPRCEANVTIIENNKLGSNSNGNTGNEDFSFFSNADEAQASMKEKLIEKGCPSQTINDAYQNCEIILENGNRNVTRKYQVTWQKNQKQYTAYVTIWNQGTSFYGNLNINEGNDITAEGNNENQHGILGNSSSNGSHSIDEMLNEAKDFIGKADGNKISGSNLQVASNTLYNILLTIGIFIAVAVGMYLGIKFMTSSAEDKAKVKESLIPYIAGCVVIFGAFIIWKLAITLLSTIA